MREEDNDSDDTKMMGASVVALVFAASIAAAQTPLRVRGTIEKRRRANPRRQGARRRHDEGEARRSPRVLTLNKMTLADVKQGTFIGITAMPQPDGSQKAVEIHIFPEPMRGTGEGHAATMPNSTMTNANVESGSTGNDGQELVINTRTARRRSSCRLLPRSSCLLRQPWPTSRAGQKFFVPNAKKMDDGTLETPSHYVGNDGVDPPM